MAESARRVRGRKELQNDQPRQNGGRQENSHGQAIGVSAHPYKSSSQFLLWGQPFPGGHQLSSYLGPKIVEWLKFERADDFVGPSS